MPTFKMNMMIKVLLHKTLDSLYCYMHMNMNIVMANWQQKEYSVLIGTEVMLP